MTWMLEAKVKNYYLNSKGKSFWYLLFVLLFLLNLSFALFLQHSTQSSMAGAITETLKPNILNREFQSAVDSISQFTQKQYSCIRYFDEDTVVLEVPHNNCASLSLISINRKIFYPGTERLVGSFVFYPKASSYALSFFLSFLVSILLVFIIYKVYQFGSEKDLAVDRERNKIEIIKRISEHLRHDIRSPLMALSTIRKSLELTNEQSEVFDAVLRKIRSICDGFNIQSIERMDMASEFHFIREQVNLAEVLRSVIKSKEIEFSDLKFNLNLSESCYVNVDQSHFSRVVSNIINNAYESYSRDSKSKEVFVELEVNQASQGPVLSIMDYGRGIESDLLNRLGVRGETTKESSGGSGLGLYHAKKFCEFFSIRFTIKNNRSSGAKVTFEFPLINQMDVDKG